MITVVLNWTNVFTRHTCFFCRRRIEKDGLLAEGYEHQEPIREAIPQPVTLKWLHERNLHIGGNNYCGCVCHNCLRATDSELSLRVQNNAADLRSWAEELDRLVDEIKAGRVLRPTYEQYVAVNESEPVFEDIGS